jgi:hypothetical protein
MPMGATTRRWIANVGNATDDEGKIMRAADEIREASG